MMVSPYVVSFSRAYVRIVFFFVEINVRFVSVLQNPRVFHRARIYLDFTSSWYWLQGSSFYALEVPVLIVRLTV